MNKQEKNQQETTRTWIKIAVLLVIIICTAALLTTYVVIKNLEKSNQSLQQQALELENTNKDLDEHVDNSGTDEGVNGVAKDDLGYVDKDTIIYDFD